MSSSPTPACRPPHARSCHGPHLGQRIPCDLAEDHPGACIASQPDSHQQIGCAWSRSKPPPQGAPNPVPRVPIFGPRPLGVRDLEPGTRERPWMLHARPTPVGLKPDLQPGQPPWSPARAARPRAPNPVPRAPIFRSRPLGVRDLGHGTRERPWMLHARSTPVALKPDPPPGQQFNLQPRLQPGLGPDRLPWSPRRAARPRAPNSDRVPTLRRLLRPPWIGPICTNRLLLYDPVGPRQPAWPTVACAQLGSVMSAAVRCRSP